MSLKPKTTTGKLIAGVFLCLGALGVMASTGVEQATTFYHSNSITASGTSQTVQTSRMKDSSCTGWVFRNRGVDTIYINLNVAAGYNGPAIASDLNMLVVGAGETAELEDALIKRFSVIGGGELYWFCGCK